MNLEEISNIAKQHFRNHYDLSKISVKDQERLMIDRLLDKSHILVCFQIPAETSENSNLLAEIKVCRKTGEIVKSSLKERH